MAQRINIFIALCFIAWSAIAGGLRSPSFVASLNAPVSTSTNKSSLLNGLISYWSFDNASLTNDLHGTNHLTIVNTVPYESGIIGNAPRFTNNVNNYFKIERAKANQLAMTGSNQMTCCFWMNIQSAPTTLGIVGMSINSLSTNAWGSFFTSPNLYYVCSTNGNNSSNNVFATLSPVSNSWYFITLLLTEISQACYTNAVVRTSESQTSLGINNTSYPFNIGTFNNTQSRIFQGLIDEVAVWNRALTTNEIQTLYNSGAGKQYPFN